jgi:hypothetical protein
MISPTKKLLLLSSPISTNQLEKASGFPIENMKQLSFCFQHATRDVFFVIFSG